MSKYHYKNYLGNECELDSFSNIQEIKHFLIDLYDEIDEETIFNVVDDYNFHREKEGLSTLEFCWIGE